jgi:hypothetical protein
VASATGGTLRYRWQTRPTAAGHHTVEARAADGAGNVSASSIRVVK